MNSEKIFMNQSDKFSLIDALFNYVTNGLISVNINGEILRINDRACELLGVLKSEVLGKHITEVFRETKLLEVMKKNYIEENIEVEVKSRKCIVTRMPVYENEAIVGAVSIFDDITQFEKLNNSWQIEKNESNFLNTILELVYDGLVVVNKKGIITKISNAYKHYLGLSDKKLVGLHITDVIENTRMHIVAQTGIAEVNDIQKIGGNYMVATRIPYYEDGKLAGAIGKVIFRNSSEIEEINRKVEFMEEELKHYKAEVISSYRVKYNLDTIITNNQKMKTLKMNVIKIGRSDLNVTIIGESGTGKELFAHAIHANSKRAYQPFVKVNCASIPENLLEAELFGYEKGAFIGANSTKVGKLELADGGTLFLDEIGYMPLPIQVKILRTLQEGEFERIGSNKLKTVNVRIITATDRDLKKMISDKTFREDLFNRISVINFDIPPLRQRKEDIKLIGLHFIDQLNRSVFKNVKGISNSAMGILLAYDWPGNIRELKNIIEVAYYFLEEGEFIEPWLLPPNLKKSTSEGINIPLKTLLEEKEKRIILERLSEFNGNKTKTALNLGISRMALHNKLVKYDFL